VRRRLTAARVIARMFSAASSALGASRTAGRSIECTRRNGAGPGGCWSTCRGRSSESACGPVLAYAHIPSRVPGDSRGCWWLQGRRWCCWTTQQQPAGRGRKSSTSAVGPQFGRPVPSSSVWMHWWPLTAACPPCFDAGCADVTCLRRISPAQILAVLTLVLSEVRGEEVSVNG